MEVRAVCIRLMMKVFFLLAAQDEVRSSIKAYAVFPQIIPNKQQFFEYESIIVNCEGLMGLTGWRVLKKNKGETQPCGGTWSLSISPCKIQNAISSIDNGEYWCEIGANKKSSSVNITVTAGSVIMKSPGFPVNKGNNVTFSCRKKRLNSASPAQFFKDGVSVSHSVTGTMTLFGVSSSDEGFYKCNISGAGESPQSWLSVTDKQEENPTPPPSPPSPPPLESQTSLLLQICIAFGIFLLVLLLLAGLLQCKKRQTIITGDIAAYSPSFSSPTPVQTVFVEAHADAPVQTMYSFNKPKKKKGSRVSQSSTGRVSSAGLLQGKKPQTVFTGDIAACSPSVSSPTPVQTAFVEGHADAPVQTMFSFNKPKKKKGSRVSQSSTGRVPSADL